MKFVAVGKNTARRGAGRDIDDCPVTGLRVGVPTRFLCGQYATLVTQRRPEAPLYRDIAYTWPLTHGQTVCRHQANLQLEAILF